MPHGNNVPAKRIYGHPRRGRLAVDGSAPPDSRVSGGLILDDQEWGPMCKKLVVLAGRYLATKRWRGTVSGHIPQAAEAIDFVHDDQRPNFLRLWMESRLVLMPRSGM